MWAERFLLQSLSPAHGGRTGETLSYVIYHLPNLCPITWPSSPPAPAPDTWDLSHPYTYDHCNALWYHLLKEQGKMKPFSIGICHLSSYTTCLLYIFTWPALTDPMSPGMCQMSLDERLNKYDFKEFWLFRSWSWSSKSRILFSNSLKFSALTREEHSFVIIITIWHISVRFNLQFVNLSMHKRGIKKSASQQNPDIPSSWLS